MSEVFKLQGQEIDVSTIKEVETDGSILRLQTSDGELEFFLENEDLAKHNEEEIKKLGDKEIEGRKAGIEEYAKGKSKKLISYYYKNRAGDETFVQVTPEEKDQLKKKKITIKEIEERRDKEKWQT